MRIEIGRIIRSAKGPRCLPRILPPVRNLPASEILFPSACSENIATGKIDQGEFCVYRRVGSESPPYRDRFMGSRLILRTPDERHLASQSLQFCNFKSHMRCKDISDVVTARSLHTFGPRGNDLGTIYRKSIVCDRPPNNIIVVFVSFVENRLKRWGQITS